MEFWDGSTGVIVPKILQGQSSFWRDICENVSQDRYTIAVSLWSLHDFCQQRIKCESCDIWQQPEQEITHRKVRKDCESMEKINFGAKFTNCYNINSANSEYRTRQSIVRQNTAQQTQLLLSLSGILHNIVDDKQFSKATTNMQSTYLGKKNSSKFCPT